MIFLGFFLFFEFFCKRKVFLKNIGKRFFSIKVIGNLFLKKSSKNQVEGPIFARSVLGPDRRVYLDVLGC